MRMVDGERDAAKAEIDGALDGGVDPGGVAADIELEEFRIVDLLRHRLESGMGGGGEHMDDAEARRSPRRGGGALCDDVDD
jgi:hypothetical protein